MAICTYASSNQNATMTPIAAVSAGQRCASRNAQTANSAKGRKRSVTATVDQVLPGSIAANPDSSAGSQ